MDQEAILNKVKAIPGKVGFYYVNLYTGETIEYHADELFESASVIKLPMFAAILKWSYEGKVDLQEKLTFTEQDKLPSCGALQFFPTPMEVDIDTLCKLMFAVSDNTATNLLLRRFGIDAFNEEFRRMGLAQSRSERLLFDSDAASRGLENRVTPREMGDLLEQFYNFEFVDMDLSIKAVDVMARQQFKHKIRGYLPYGYSAINKTGEDHHITNDVGAVNGDHPCVICWLTNHTDVPAAERAIREISLQLVEES